MVVDNRNGKTKWKTWIWGYIFWIICSFIFVQPLNIPSYPTNTHFGLRFALWVEVREIKLPEAWPNGRNKTMEVIFQCHEPSAMCFFWRGWGALVWCWWCWCWWCCWQICKVFPIGCRCMLQEHFEVWVVVDITQDVPFTWNFILPFPLKWCDLVLFWAITFTMEILNSSQRPHKTLSTSCSLNKTNWQIGLVLKGLFEDFLRF